MLNLPQHKLKGDVITRWGSTYDMVSRVIEQQQAISAVFLEDRKHWSNMLTDIELGTLEIVEEILKTVSSLTDALAGEKEVTVSAIPCILKHIKNKFSPSNTLVVH